MAKFTIHFEGGDWTGHSSTSKQKMIDECDSMFKYAYVAEEYIEPSPFDGKPSKHARKVYENNKTKVYEH